MLKFLGQHPLSGTGQVVPAPVGSYRLKRFTGLAFSWAWLAFLSPTALPWCWAPPARHLNRCVRILFLVKTLPQFHLSCIRLSASLLSPQAALAVVSFPRPFVHASFLWSVQFLLLPAPTHHGGWHGTDFQ